MNLDPPQHTPNTPMLDENYSLNDNEISNYTKASVADDISSVNMLPESDTCDSQVSNNSYQSNCSEPIEVSLHLSTKKTCVDEYESNDVSPYEKAVDITPNRDGGIMKQILRPGINDLSPGFGNKVFIKYTGYLCVGSTVKEFESSGNDKVNFHLGKGAVIRGLDWGVSSMQKNEIALFIIYPQYAYGQFGNPPTIPPQAVLIFQVELLDWKLEDLSPKKNEGILRKVITKGEGTSVPNEGAIVEVAIKGSFKNKVFEDYVAKFVLGEGFSIGIPEGIEVALQKFKLMEKSILYLKGQYAIELQHKFEELFTADSVVEYEVFLQYFEKAKEIWEMNSDEKYAQALEAKTKGIQHIKNGNYKFASKQFRKIISYLENEPGIAPDSEAPRKILLNSAYLNESLCQMKLENFTDAIKVCDKILQVDRKNEKALYRRGQCHLSINDCEEALKDFQNVLDINPSNNACKKLIAQCWMKMNDQKIKDKKTYSNMFQKFMDQDEEERRKRTLKTEEGVWEKKTGKTSLTDDCNNIVKMLISLNCDK